ncbi:acetyl-CoA carboxylase biotin carboxylase subunit [Aestuariivirga sp. YIM B02566]|uniref:Acetyl/propionyl/methylcrotonyl-CoA carboxylase subunit alpha n=1 Tax=Taklimakanibacter albus TaxID=2800327 RepID=A0ACC5R228_9HYPH|nr:acetyl/propionyl/methylcrotonyl-CoA carboxylase subunit alpha [Aestuariivirga sp. YIM B02566]MBK1866695.1 acetyl/propionyl/methylcrotonyl-CoA carboxylase subunit alpha [Aestuariivirga sp. YIM B02566]
MFKKILIANRGEIACRVIKTARRMGIKTVAVYSEADAASLHVEMADEAVAIGAAPAAQSYLVIEKIIEACKKTGAEAVHPGYGFLSERSAFPRALAEAGITFIGPNPGAIDAMGDKIESKKAAAAAKVSTVPGHLGIIEDEAEAVKIAQKIGYPVMIKASAGGGGKGMRIAHSDAEVLDGFARARSEAKSSFGDDRVFIEKFIVNPRHVEIQVLGDKHGNVIYLGERECSIQRRNQKVIEEAPSPLLDEKTRKAMGEQAVALAKAVNYDSAGTVEFVAGQDRSFFFLEMNTRLQVEHPVTELITGIDLVEQMIRVAAGEKLALAQKDVKLKGWAVESRVYAEDPYRNFLPSTGRLIKYRPPKESSADGITVRNDTGVFEGGEISIYYDPMIAKLCTHAADRATAIAAMGTALDEFYVDGIQHNIPFLSAIMENERWKSGELSTGFIAEEFQGGFTGNELTQELKARLSAVAVMADHVENRRKRLIGGQMNGRKVKYDQDRVVRLGANDWLPVSIVSEDERVLTLDNGKPCFVKSAWAPGQEVWRGEIDGKPVSVLLRKILNGYRLSHRGVSVDAHVFSGREAELARLMPEKKAADTSKKLLCPMPGLVVSIAVVDGQEIKAGEPLAIVEAMKMENILRAERDAVVKKVHVKKGDSLAVDAVIMEFA